MIHKIVQKVKKHHSKDGIKGLIRRTFTVFSSFIIRRETHVVGCVNFDDIRPFTSPAKLNLLLLDESNLSAFRKFAFDHNLKFKYPRVLNSHIKNGFKCYLATLSDEIIGYNWFTEKQDRPEHNHPHLLRYDIELQKDELYGFDFYISPQHRGGGNSVEFYTVMRFRLKAQGFKKIYGYVDAANRQASWFYKLMGQKEINEVKTCKIFNYFLIMNKRVYLKNNRLFSSRPFDYRPLFSIP